MTINSYIHDFDRLDISDFIKKYYAKIRQKIFIDINYVNYVQENFNQVQNMLKYISIPIFYRSSHDTIKDNYNYIIATKKKMLKLLPIYLYNKEQQKLINIEIMHSKYVTDLDSYNILLNIKNILISK